MPDGTVVQNGDIIEAWPEEIRGALDKFEPITYIVSEDGGVPTAPTPESTLKIVHRGGGKYNVVDQNGNAVNDRLLSKEDAENLMNGIEPPLVKPPIEVEDPPESPAVRKAVGKKVAKQAEEKANADKPKDGPMPLPIPEPTNG
jgi:hypothetical protein